MKITVTEEIEAEVDVEIVREDGVIYLAVTDGKGNIVCTGRMLRINKNGTLSLCSSFRAPGFKSDEDGVVLFEDDM